MLQCLIACIEVRRETVEMWIRPCAIPSIVGSGFDLARSLTDRMGPHNDAGQAGIGGCLVVAAAEMPRRSAHSRLAKVTMPLRAGLIISSGSQIRYCRAEWGREGRGR